MDSVSTIVFSRVSWVRRGGFSDIFVTYSGSIKFNGSNKLYNNNNEHEGDANGEITSICMSSVNNSSIVIIITPSVSR